MAGTVAPRFKLKQSVFNALNPLDYDSAVQAFKNSAGVRYFLFVQKQSSDPEAGEWFNDTDSGGGVNPRGLVPRETYDVISGGSYNSSDNTVSYGGDSYVFALERDLSAGTVIAKAIVV